MEGLPWPFDLDALHAPYVQPLLATGDWAGPDPLTAIAHQYKAGVAGTLLGPFARKKAGDGAQVARVA